MSKKYFIHGSDTVLSFGDSIKMSFTIKGDDGTRFFGTREVGFSPDWIAPLLLSEVIEEKEVDDTPHRICFLDEDVTGELDREYENIINHLKLIDIRLKNLESFVGDFSCSVDELNGMLDEVLEPSQKGGSNIKKNKYESGKKWKNPRCPRD